MRVILTHEQADFDAVASQLGVYLLDERAYPVLPQRLNHNVRAFLNIYGVDLPYVERRDLPKRPIDAITLVDTQSMTGLKGMSKDAQVSVVDHHPLRTGLPSDWNLTVQPTGATTTLLVKVLQEQDIHLNITQATLLLLGIYEDTGSLTYTRTTPHDLQAAAYLIENGASLQIAVDYLNHPLSITQQILFEQIRACAKTHVIHDQTIVISSGDGCELNEELSSITHKLRDLLDPDGLVLLFQTRGGIQLIARSTSDRFNVAEIAAHFGGGGHNRAAAALIKDRNLKNVQEELHQILPRHVHPPITVAQIMSRGPQLLSPDTPVGEVAQRMQRYGYEGYPIVDKGNVIGLITRRAVDRATAHKLNLPIRNLMEAGEVTIRPGESLEHLRQVMTDTGWGQIPVVDDTNKIIGIVTRTDLLKMLAPEPAIPGRCNLAGRLESALPPDHLLLLKTLAEAAHQQQNALYIVGGFVRDLLLERPSLDFDLVVEGDAIALAQILRQKHGGRVTSHARFGTAKWFLDKQLISKRVNQQIGKSAKEQPSKIDLITARTEFYTHPTALPTVERGSIKLDLHRRDFTINTLALRLDGRHFGELHDYWGGYADLRQGQIRVLHSLSFVDDPTRMLRAVRFEQRFGFQIEARTLELLHAANEPSTDSGQGLLDRVSGDRIRHELETILFEPNAPAMLDRLYELGLLTAIHKNLPWDRWIRAKITSILQDEPDHEWGLDANWRGIPLSRALAYTLWLIRTSVDCIRSITRRLKFPADLETAILAAGRLWTDLPMLDTAAPSAIVVRLDNLPILTIYAAYQATDDTTQREMLYNYVVRWQHIRPTSTGHDLLAIDMAPGPIYGEILTTLRAAWLDGEVKSREEEKALLKRLLRQNVHC